MGSLGRVERGKEQLLTNGSNELLVLKVEVFCDVAIRAGLILSVSCLVLNLITRFSSPVSPSQTTAVDRRAA